MSLLDDLKNVKVLALIDDHQKNYPSSHKKIMNDLKNSDFVGDLSVFTAQNLISFAVDSGMHFDTDSFVLKLYKIFDK